MDSIDGQMVILSGLTRKTTQLETQKVPVLGEIPFVGDWLFSRKNKGEKNTELLMAVTIGVTSAAQETEKLERLHRNLENGPKND
jgi:type II secretory pathway component GspD/PulD (secretin)